MNSNIIIIVMGVVMVVAAIGAIYSKKLVSAIVMSGAVSLMASIIYLQVAAPDVAMTEAAIGSALTTVVFLFALSRVKGKEADRD
jgi:energy-converting hydrogenase B subunit D